MSNYLTFYDTLKYDPVELLKQIKQKIYDPAKAVYCWETFTNIITRFVSDTKQAEGQDLIDYVKRFKQAKDLFKQTIGSKFTEAFMKISPEYAKISKKEDK